MAERTPREPLAAPSAETDWPVPWEPVEGKRGGLASRLEYVALRAVMEVVGRLPDGARAAVYAALARVAPRLDRRHADAARRFLDQALGPLEPPERERRVRQAYRHFLRVLVDSWRLDRELPFERTLEHFAVDLDDDARRLFASEHGCVLVTGHLGNWEAGTAILPWLGLEPAYVIGKPVKNRYLSRAIQRMREARHVRLLPRRGAMKSAAAIMKAGGALAMVLDQRARQRPVLAPFFGRPARCDRSAGVLLRRLKVPVGVLACLYTGEPLRFRLVTSEVLWPEEFAAAGPAEIAARVNRALERLIRAYPDQYFWLHDRYRDTPDTLEEALDGPAEDGLRVDQQLSSGGAEAQDRARETP